MSIKEAIDKWKMSNTQNATYGDLLTYGKVLPDEHYLDGKTYTLNINGKNVEYNEKEIYEQMKINDKNRLQRFQ